MKVTARALSPRTRVVTQTLTRPFTTITAVVTLGDGPPPTPTHPPPPPPPSHSHAPETIAPAPHAGSLTPPQLGALLGSGFGLAFVALLVCCFISCNRKRQRTTNPPEYYYDYDDSLSESEVVQVETMRGTAAGWTLRQNQGGRGGGWGGGGAGAGGTGTGRVVRGAWTTVPPPVRFPPTPRHAGYSQTREQQIGGVRRYP
jgi:hypothetical protein